MKPSFEDLGGDAVQVGPFGERVRAQNCEGVLGSDTQLGDDHAGRPMDPGAIRPSRERGLPARARVVQQCRANGVRQELGVVQAVGQPAGA